MCFMQFLTAVGKLLFYSVVDFCTLKLILFSE